MNEANRRVLLRNIANTANSPNEPSPISGHSRFQAPSVMRHPAVTSIENIPFGRISIFVLAFYLFVRFSMLNDYVAATFGVRSRYQYFCIPVIVFASFLSGRSISTLTGRIGICSCGFLLWMAASVPTSFWRGGSVGVLLSYIQNEFPVFLAVGSLTASLAAQRRVMYAMAFATPVFVVITALGATTSYTGRLTLPFGIYANSNSIATHLLFLSPFLLFFARERGKPIALALSAATFTAACFFFFKTGSRAGLLSLCVMFAAWFLRLPSAKRAIMAMLVAIAVPALVAVIPAESLARYRTIFSSESDDVGQDPSNSKLAEVALESTASRALLFFESVSVSFQRPIFGVGPGQYSPYSAELAASAGRRGSWLVTHNSYTQVSSEMGLVGFAFYAGMLLGAGLLLRRLRNSTKDIPHLRSAHRAAACLFQSWICYCIFSIFDSVAYSQYLPLLAGFACGLAAAIENELQKEPALV